MTFTKDSPLAGRVYPTASSEQGLRPGGAADIKGITIHMAEGGGTVTWLARPDGNSSHYVVEYTGRITQMVKETHWAGSINPNLLRQTNDAPFTYLGEVIVYGKSPAVAALGATAWRDPNRYVIAIEVEGFAAVGPNTAQRKALRGLVNDIRRRRGVKPTLGHRDFQSYKKCPGHHIPWVDYGGHAKKVAYQPTPAPIPTPTPTPEAVMDSFLVPEVPTRVYVEEDPARPGNSKWLYSSSARVKDGKETSLGPAAAFPDSSGVVHKFRPLVLSGFYSADVYIVAYEPAAGDADATSRTMFISSTDIEKTEPIPAASVDCGPAIKAAVDHDRTLAHIVYS